jgi:hypothetical protein
MIFSHRKYSRLDRRPRWKLLVPLVASLTLLGTAACAIKPGQESTPGGKDSALPSTAPSSPSPQTASPPTAGSDQPGSKIRVLIGDTVLTGRLWDNATARSLIAQLPLTVNLRDHNGQEKTGPLPQELSMDGMPEGDDPMPNDIGYYAPGNDVVFYYGDVGYWNGIARIGMFDSSMDVIKDQTGDFTATIELAD